MTAPDVAPTRRAPDARGRVYRDGEVHRDHLSPDDLGDALRDEGSVGWLDLLAPDPDTVRDLADKLDLHPLAVEDALAEPQRPKLDRYPGHLFIAVYLLGYDAGSFRIDPTELSVFVTDRLLITVRARDTLDVAELTGRWDQHAELSRHGVGFLLHGLLDLVVDQEHAMTRKLEDAVDDLEESLFDDPSGNGVDVQRRGFQLRTTLARARRLAQPTVDLLHDLKRPGVDVIDEGLAPYYADVRDHAVRSAERLDGMREQVGTVLDTRLALRSDQLNEIMKRLTGWAAIITVPTAITGFYGQNVPYPGFEQESGFVASATLCVLIVIGLFVLLRRRGWI